MALHLSWGTNCYLEGARACPFMAAALNQSNCGEAPSQSVKLQHKIFIACTAGICEHGSSLWERRIVRYKVSLMHNLWVKIIFYFKLHIASLGFYKNILALKARNVIICMEACGSWGERLEYSYLKLKPCVRNYSQPNRPPSPIPI